MTETDQLLGGRVRHYPNAQVRGPPRGYSSIQRATPVSGISEVPAIELLSAQETAAPITEPVAASPQAEENTRLLTSNAAAESDTDVPAATEEADSSDQTASTDSPEDPPPNRRNAWPLIGFILGAVATAATILIIVFTNSSHTNNTTYVVCVNGTAICPDNPSVHYDCNTTAKIPFPCKRHDVCNPFANDCNSPFGQCVYNQTCMCFDCVCLGGYITYPNGTYCHPIPLPPPCPINPCQNGGSCIYHPNATNPNSTTFECVCPPSTTGDVCQFTFCTSTTQFYGNQSTTPFVAPSGEGCPIVTQNSNRLWVVQDGIMFVYDTGNQTLLQEWEVFTSFASTVQIVNDTEVLVTGDCQPGQTCIAYYNYFGVQGFSLSWQDYGRCDLIMDPDNTQVATQFAAIDASSGTVIVLLAYQYLSTTADYALRFSSNFTACLNTQSLLSIPFLGGVRVAAMDSSGQLYFQIPGTDTVFQFNTHNFSSAVTTFMTLATVQLQPIPVDTWSAAQGISWFTINDDVFLALVNYRNWTNVEASAMLRFNLNTSEWLPTVLTDLPAIFVGCPVFGAGRLFYSASDLAQGYPLLFSQVCQGINDTIPDCSGNCGPTGTCQDGFCRCTSPWFTGNFPSCSRITNTIICDQTYMIAFNLPISCESVPMGAVLSSGFQAQQPYFSSGYAMAFGSPLSSDTFALSTLTDSFTQATVSRVLPPPDDRDFVYFARTPLGACPPSYISFHYNVSTLLYLGLVDDSGVSDVLVLYDFTNDTTIRTVTFNRLARDFANCLGNKPWLPIFIAPDARNTIWVIISTAETLTLVRYTSDLLFNLSCQNLGPTPAACSASKSVVTCESPADVTYSCAGLFQDVLYLSPDAGGAELSMFNYTLNSTYAAFPMVTSSSTVTSNAFGTNWNMYSFSQFRTTGDLLVEFRASSVLNALRELGLNQSVISQQTYGTFHNAFTIFPNYAGSVWMSSRFPQQQSTGAGRANPPRLQGLDASLRLARLNVSTSVCQLGQNGGCGIRQCIETPSQNTRCDVCRAFFAAENVTAWSGFPADFQIQYFYTDPFDTKTLARQLFVTGGNSTSIYLVDVDTGAVTRTVPTVLVDDVVQLSMSLDTHTHIIYAAARSNADHSNGSVIVAAVDYLTGASVYNLTFASLNLPAESDWTTKGLFVNSVRCVFLMLSNGSEMVMFKLESNLTVIASGSLPSFSLPIFEYRFSYDLNMFLSTPSIVGSVIRFCALGGVGYVPSFRRQVFLCVSGNNGYYDDMTFSSNIYRFDVTAWGAVAYVQLATIQSSSPTETVWSVNVVDRYGTLVQTIPLQWLVRAGVDFGGEITNVHLAVWGDLFAVNSDGRVLRAACRKYS